jgi:poly-D-alanine transfer protein DltD
MTAFEAVEQKLFFQIDSIAERNFDSITKQTRNIIADKLDIDPKNRITLEVYDNQVKMCKLERLIFTTFNSKNKNRLILTKLKEKYTDLSRSMLENYEKAVTNEKITENEYILYARQLKEGHTSFGKICEIGMQFCKT